MKSIVTKYTEICALCGKPASDPHHLVYGRGLRKLADSDYLVLSVCRNCHDEIHKNGAAGQLSKIAGQLAWEKRYVARQAEIPFEDLEEEAREEFRSRYGVSFL